MKEKMHESQDKQKGGGFAVIVIFTVVAITLAVLLKVFVFPD